MKFAVILISILTPFVAWFSTNQTSADTKSELRDLDPTATDKDDVVTAGADVRIDSPVNADLILAGKKVSVMHPVEGYVVAAGEEIIVDAPVGNDILAAASIIEIRNEVSDNVWVAGKTVTLTKSGHVRGNASLAGETVQVLGSVDKTLRIAASSVMIDAEVVGDVEVFSQQFELSQEALIHGDLTVTSPNPPRVPDGAVVEGQLIHRPFEDEQGSATGNWLSSWVMMFFMAMIVGGFVLLLFPNWIDGVASQLSTHPGRSLLTGILGFVLLPILCVVFAITIVGMPLALMLGALFAAALVLSIALTSYWLGREILDRFGKPESGRWSRLAIGALSLSLLGSAPSIGFVVQIAVFAGGLGVILLTLSRGRQCQFDISVAG